MPEQRALTPNQRRAAALLASGTQDKVAAHELGVVPKSIQRWKQRDDFRALVRKQREGLMPETPTAEAVLVSALSATKPSGDPDWQNRIAAARAILAAEIASPEARQAAERVTTVYLPDPSEDEEDEDVGAARPFPIDGARNERFQEEPA